MYCNRFQSSKENGSACVFLKHDLFCTATIPCVCLSSKSINPAHPSLSTDTCIVCVIIKCYTMIFFKKKNHLATSLQRGVEANKVTKTMSCPKTFGSCAQ